MTEDTVPGLGNLPAEPNSFVGRERDLGDLTLLLSNVRALTLCGPGGIGKSRLATRLGWQLADAFPDGVWFVELADHRDPVHAVRRVADVLGISEEPHRPVAATLVDALVGRELLLILDTCEHVVEAIADLVRDLIAGCPLIRVVATSREPLRVRGETVWRVPPLSLPGPGLQASLPPGGPLPDTGMPDQAPLPAASGRTADSAMAAAAQHEAIQLFVDRASAVRPGFALTAGNCAVIVQLCRTLDGVPLAIELAAARMRALSVEQIAARIDDRFRLLASGDRTAPPRQQTLQATVDWSFELLTRDEQILLRRLSVFAGWSLDMAEQVCADDRISVDQVLELLAALIDKSLVALEDELAGDARYRLLDTIRGYASAHLAAAGEQAEFRRRHRDYLLRLIEDVVGQAFVRDVMPWPEQVANYHRVAAEQANLRAALACCVDDADAENGLRLCSALRSPWVVQGDVTEGLRWFGTFLSMPGRVPASVRARALMLAAELAFEHQDYPQASQRAATALAMSASSRAVCPAGALRILALISLRAGRGDESLAQADAAVAAARECADEWEEGLALSAKATILARSGQVASAQDSFEAALSLLSGNNGWGVAHTLYGLGSLARARRDNAAALRHFSSALELFRQIGARTEMARCLAGIGWVCLASLNLPTAAASLSESLELSVATGQRLGIARGLEAFAALAVAQRDDATAVRLEGASAVLRDAIDPVRSGPAQGRLDGLLAPAHQRLGPARTASLQAEGRRLSTHDAVRYALRSADGTSQPTAPATGTGTGAAVPQVPMSVLTVREQQVAMLITRGLSNRDIATELVISPATAARHVANILGKLGLSSRAQVAAWAADRRSAAAGRDTEA
ncbi:MAG TPA: LuxR C-terminal-related transcriptional regulator [Streptosporangiaceae bacterium]|nr:LuxR C-terminal-related transcriptional regulator [Streptosporangiaceae bacterium]